MDIPSYLIGKKSSGGGGGGGSSVDWSKIGYSSEPASFTKDFNYTKEFYNNWDATITNRNQAFTGIHGEYPIVWFPNVNTSNITNTYRMFYNNTNLREVQSFDFSNVTDARGTFEGCTSLEEVGDVLLNEDAQYSDMFKDCYELKHIKKLKTSHLSSGSAKKIINFTYTGYGDITIDELLFDFGNNSKEYFTNINRLDIKKITYIGSRTSMSYAMYSNCNLTDGTIKETLKFLTNMTGQTSSSKTLKNIGLTETDSNKAILMDEWQPLAEAGWTTGYETQETL